MFFLNISTEHKEYCDNFYMTVHNVKNLQIIKYTILYTIFTHLWRAKHAKFLPMARRARIEAKAKIAMSGEVPEICGKTKSNLAKEHIL